MPPYEDSMLQHPYPIGQGEIIYCPTHAAAFKMLDFIKHLDFGNDCGCVDAEHDKDCLQLRRDKKREAILKKLTP